MIIEKVLGNLHDLPAETWTPTTGFHQEKVVLPSAQLVKRIQRVTTDHGKELGIRLPCRVPADLRDGDILHRGRNQHDRGVRAAHRRPGDRRRGPSTKWGSWRTRSATGTCRRSSSTPTSEYGAEVMVCQYDHTVEDYLKHVGVPYDRQERVMPVPFRHAEHTPLSA